MAKRQLSMSSGQIAKVVGTVGSPLIVVAELLKNAVDASAKEIKVIYNREEKYIAVENDYKGFSLEEIEALSQPGISTKKVADNLKNENGMFLTGSKGLGLLSVFLLCNEAEIITAPEDKIIYKIILNKENGTVEEYATDQKFERHFTRVILKNVSQEVIEFLSSESEVRKLRHISTYLYKRESFPFPKMILQISNHEPRVINFSCIIPPMMYDVYFKYSNSDCSLRFQCISPKKPINKEEVCITSFSLESLQNLMLEYYGIKECIPTRTNDLILSNFSEVPNFEGRILVYEKNMAGSQLKTYGAGVNVYVNEFALYNYLADDNDWLGLADYTMRKKVSRLKPHNVFGYVNFPCFNENLEKLQISNERADFIRDLTFTKLMYLLKGVVMFIIFNIDVADKNPKYKSNLDSQQEEPGKGNSTNPEGNTTPDTEQDDSDDETDYEFDDSEQDSKEDNSSTESSQESSSGIGTDLYSPENAYKPKQNVRKSLEFTKEEGEIINNLNGVNNLNNKIYNLVFELSKLDLQVHRCSIAYLYRALLESSTKFLAQRQNRVKFYDNALESSIVSALNYFGEISSKGTPLSQKTIKAWRDIITSRKLIDTLNEYIHNELPVDAFLLQETWNVMRGYIIACLSIQ